MLAARLADGLRGTGVQIPDARVRAPHILSLGFAGGMPDALIGRLAAENVHVAPRLGRLRISPHVYNDETDVDRFIEVFHRLMRAYGGARWCSSAPAIAGEGDHAKRGGGGV
jgi:selenocysteine lyase/cysteine desulfurase